MSNCVFCATSVPLTCSIVGGKVKRNQNPRGKGAPLEFKENGVDFDILDHLKTFYILKEILKLRNETLLEFLGLCEGESYPEHWVNVCDLCGVYVKKFYENQKLILKLEKSNAQILSFLRGEIEESRKDEGKSGGPLWGRIRSEAFKDFRTESSPLNGVKIKVDLDATPVNRESQNTTENHEQMEGVEATKGSADEDRGMFLYASSDEDANDITDMIGKTTDQGIQVDEELNSNQRSDEGEEGLSKGIPFEDEETTETDKEVERIMTRREEDRMSEILSEDDEGVSSASESEQESQSEAAVPVTVPPIVVDLSSDEEDDDDDEEYYSQAEPDRATCVSKKTEETVPPNKTDLPSTPESRKEVQVKMIDCQTQTDDWNDDDEYNVDKQTQEEVPSQPQVEEGAQLRENQTSCSTSTDPPPEVMNDVEKQTQEKASSPPPQVNNLLNVVKEPPAPIFIDLADSDDEDDGEKNKRVSSETETKSTPTVPPTDSVEKTDKDNVEKTKIDIPVSTEVVAPKAAEAEIMVPIFAPLVEKLSKQGTQTPAQVLSTREGTEDKPYETTSNTPEETRATLETEITVNVASNHQELVPETIEVGPETEQELGDSQVQPELVQNTNQECVHNLMPKPTEEMEAETVDESSILFNLLLHPEDNQEETSQPESSTSTVITRLEEATAEAHPSEQVVSEFTIHFQPHPESGEVSNQDSQPVVFEAHLDGEIPSQSQSETSQTAPVEPVENPVATAQPVQVVPEAIATTPASRAIPTPVITPTADIFNLNLLALVTLEAAGKEKEHPIIPAPSANSQLPPPENIAGSSSNPIEINGHDDHHHHNDTSSIISTPNSNSNQTVFLSEPGRKKIFILKKKISSSSATSSSTTATTTPPPVTQTPIPLSIDATSQQSVDLFRRPTILRGPRPPSTSIPALSLVPAPTPEPSISFPPVPKPPPPSKEAPKPKKKRKEPPANKPTFHENSGHFLCHICKFKTKIMERLQKHLELEHHDSQKKMLCPKPDCDRLVFPKFLHEHLRLGHGPPEKRKQVRKTHLTALPESPIKMKRKRARLELEASLEAALPVVLDFDQPLFKCSKCPAMEATLEDFKSHLKLHDEGSFAVTCKDCGLTMPPSQLEAHSKLPHHKNTESPTKTSPKPPKSPGERTKCPKCPAAFSNRDTMKSHLRIHVEGSNAVICPEPNCGWLVLPQRLSHHQIKHHPENHEKCLMCNINFFNKVSFQEHQKLHANGHICEQCGYLCKSIAQHNAWWHPKGGGPKSKNGKRQQTLPKLPKSPLKRAEAGGAIVISQNNVEVVDVSDGRVECDVCGWMTKNPEKHKVKYHPKSVTNGDSSQKPVENPQEYIVAKKKRNEANSNPHYTTFVVEGRRHYKCKVCGAKKRSLTLFRTHYKNHEEPGKAWAAGAVNKQGQVKRKYQKRKTTSKSKKVKRRSTRIQKKK